MVCLLLKCFKTLNAGKAVPLYGDGRSSHIIRMFIADSSNNVLVTVCGLCKNYFSSPSGAAMVTRRTQPSTHIDYKAVPLAMQPCILTYRLPALTIRAFRWAFSSVAFIVRHKSVKQPHWASSSLRAGSRAPMTDQSALQETESGNGMLYPFPLVNATQKENYHASYVLANLETRHARMFSVICSRLCVLAYSLVFKRFAYPLIIVDYFVKSPDSVTKRTHFWIVILHVDY